METRVYTREREREERGGREKIAKEREQRCTREKKTRYTCLKERRDTHSTVTKHPSFGRAQKRIEGTKPMVERKKRRKQRNEVRGTDDSKERRKRRSE